MDIVAAATLWLRADPAVCATVGVDSAGDPLIVQDSAPDRAEFTNRVCLVVQHAGFEAGNDHNTYQQARVMIEFWSDPHRGPGGLLESVAAGRDRMVTAYQAVDRRLHRPQGGEQRWGDPAGVLTVDCARRAGLLPYLVPGSDGLWRGTAAYAVGLG